MSSNKRTLVVTGASGFLGRAVVRQALAHRMTVHAVVRRRNALSPAEGLHLHVIDLLGGSAAARLGGIPGDAFIHLAALLPQKRADRTAAALATTAMALPVMHAAAHRAVRIVLAGSSSEYGPTHGAVDENVACRPVTEYGAAKYALTQLALGMTAAHSLDAIVLRPFVIYGPGQANGMFVPDLVRSCITGFHFPMTGGEQRRDFIYVEDAARAFIAASAVAMAPARLLNISTGTPTRVIDVAHQVADAFHRRDLLGVGELPYPDGDPGDFVGRADRAEQALSWQAQVPLRVGIERVVSAARRTGMNDQHLSV